MACFLQEIDKCKADRRNEYKPSHWLKVSKCLLDNTVIDHSKIIFKFFYEVSEKHDDYSAPWMLELPHVPEEKNQGVVDNVRSLYVEQAIFEYFMIRKFAYTEEFE